VAAIPCFLLSFLLLLLLSWHVHSYQQEVEVTWALQAQRSARRRRCNAWEKRTRQKEGNTSLRDKNQNQFVYEAVPTECVLARISLPDFPTGETQKGAHSSCARFYG
jgi:hypothetical protein